MRWGASILLIFLIFQGCHSPEPESVKNETRPRVSGHDPFNRNGLLIYTKHARCRMDCRHITAKEIHEILDEGTINYQKSEPNGRPDPRYALEGFTAEQQHLRIVIAPEENKLILVTCIELGVEWSCHCD